MTAETWAANGGRLNSYRATIGHHTWVLSLAAVGWVMESITTRSMAPVFVAAVTADTDRALRTATSKARRVA